ncbi:MAG: cation transporter [Lysobacterales bacterium]
MELQVEQMSCQHCVRAVTAALKALDAAAEVQVDLAAGRVQVRGALDPAAAAAALTAEGYPARPL